MLLKPYEVEWVEVSEKEKLETDSEIEKDISVSFESKETIKSKSYEDIIQTNKISTDEVLIDSTAIVIGGENIEFLDYFPGESTSTISLKPIEEEIIYVGTKPLLIGAEIETIEDIESDIESKGEEISEYFIQEDSTELTELEKSEFELSDFETEELKSEIESETFEEEMSLEEKDEISEEEALMSQFEDTKNDLKLEDDSKENWMNIRNKTLIGRIDDKIRSFAEEQRKSLKDVSAEQLFQISEDQRSRLLAESMRYGGGNIDPSTYEEILTSLNDHINSLVIQHQETLQVEMEEGRELIIRDIEAFVENTINKQRELMLAESQEYISKVVQDFKDKLLGENKFIKTANSIIAEREQILDEAYNNSLKIIQDAEAEAARITEESMTRQDQANVIIAEAEEQAEMIKQEAKTEAERIIEEANLESSRIIEAAEQSHGEIVESATQDGYNVGYQEGREEAIKENAQLLMETINSLNKLHAAFPIAVRQNEDKIIKLALEIAQAIIQDELVVKPDVCIRTVKKAVKSVSEEEKVIIKVNPSDLDSILPKQEYFRALLPDVQDFVITGHKSVEKGFCIIEPGAGEIDVPIKTQIAVFEEIFSKIQVEIPQEEKEEIEEAEMVDMEGMEEFENIEGMEEFENIEGMEEFENIEGMEEFEEA